MIQKISQPTSELIRKPEVMTDIGKSLFRYKTSEEILIEKVTEFKNNTNILEQKIHLLINEERRKNNLNSLTWDEDLAKIARYHSKDMATKDYFAHESPEGEDLETRYKKFGYFCRISVGNLIYSGAENIFLHYIYDSYYYDPLTGKITGYVFNSLDDISYDVVTGWMNSEGHRRNILTSFFRKEGIGVYINDDGKIYVTQNFC
ncbi:MAG: CAP domain-containing protein [Candidatus Aenigmarchaeota archaeon]|nr:CAP domain-containing protein [Candidatus Aenigmarchaeota archaeon]MDW8149549.1 CAP domain-containing protein [Candidatus Aenigmarchaeota archaeon]